MRVATGCVVAGDPEAGVAIDAVELAVADDALGRVGGCLLVVDRDEIRAVHRIAHRLIETKARGNRGNGDAVACRALTLRVAGRAQIALSVRLHAMLAKEIATVDHVAFGKSHLAGEVDMAPATVARRPLVLVGMAAEAGRMLGLDVVGIDGDVHMAADAVSRAFLAMEFVREAKVAPGHLGGVPISGAPMAVGASVRIVRFRVALDTVLGGRPMERTGLAGRLHAVVAFEAIDALHHVGAVLERVVLLLLLEAEHLGAGACEAGQRDERHDCEPSFHRFPRQLC